MLHFDYRWDVASGVDFQRSTQKQEAVKMWLAQYIAVDGEWVDWFIEHWVSIRKAILNFMAKFF